MYFLSSGLGARLLGVFACGAFSRFSLFIIKVVSLLTSLVSGVCFPIFSYFSLVYLFSLFLRVVVLWTDSIRPSLSKLLQSCGVLRRLLFYRASSTKWVRMRKLEAKTTRGMLEDRGRIVVGSHKCTIRATGPPQLDVCVHYYLFEASDADIRGALSKFGQIKSLRYLSFPRYHDVKTGSGIINVAAAFPVEKGPRGTDCKISPVS